ncbi:MAG: hypothetical protein WBL02_08325 [Methanomethylovorans sp.]|uniref:hypothetical protein n=1 Tax=Methanomethylovorans sp. TaxID=2758717 RepID=UPI003C76567F
MIAVTEVLPHIELQFFILLLLIFSSYMAHSKKIKVHCSLMGTALILQLITIIFVMLPTFSALSEMQISGQLLLGLWVHHIAGILVVLLVIYIDLAVKGSVHFLGEPYKLMRPVALLWFLALFGGIHIYLSL